MNSSIWDDVLQGPNWVRVFMKDGSSYLGYYRFSEEYEREPIIGLTHYQKLDKDSDVVIDYSDNDDEVLLVNTEGFDRIEVTRAHG